MSVQKPTTAQPTITTSARTRRSRVCVMAALGTASLLACLSQPAQASSVYTGFYQLLNYGFQQNSNLLLAETPGHPLPKFSVEGGSGIQLTLDPTSLTANIQGQVVNDLDGSFWDVSYTLTGHVANPNPHSASRFFTQLGSIRMPRILLEGSPREGFDFRMIFDGQRSNSAAAVIMAHGWLRPSSTAYPLSTPLRTVAIPSPSAVWLGLSMFGAMATIRQVQRRRRPQPPARAPRRTMTP